MEISWFPFSVAATVLIGISMAFFKLPSVKQQNRFVAALWSLCIPLVLSLFFFWSYLPLTSFDLVVTAFVWGTGFAGLTLLQMYALSHVDTNVLFPLSTTTSLVLTATAGVFLFQETPTLTQGLGTLLAVSTVFLFLYKGGEIRLSSAFFILGSSIVFVSAFNKIVQKFAADSFDIHVFQIYQYAFGSLFAFMVLLLLHRHDWKSHLFKGGMGIGVLIGVFSFLGGYSLLLALTKGPLTLITSIHSLYIFVTAVTAYLLFGERINKRKIFLLIFAVIAVILIKVG